jgi:hypothetical protein
MRYNVTQLAIIAQTQAEGKHEKRASILGITPVGVQWLAQVS